MKTKLTARERYDRITDYIREHGVTAKEAAAALGESAAFYYSGKIRFGKNLASVKPKRIRKTVNLRTDFIDIPLNTTTEEQKIALIITTPSQIRSIVEGLWK